MSDWLPMEGAPRTGDPILLKLSEPMQGNDIAGYVPFSSISVVIGWWDYPTWKCCFGEEADVDSCGGSSFFSFSISPIGWMPLPT